MPAPSDILAALAAISNRAVWLAVAWHVLLAIVLIALTAGWRPSARAVCGMIAAPFASVAFLAFGFDSPFNGVVFAAAAAVFLGLAARPPIIVAERRRRWSWWIGAAALGFAWVYPHFLDLPPIAYLVAAPVGLVPCPTLAAAIGLMLVAGMPCSRRAVLALAALGLFYGGFGVIRLGVALDLGLVAFAAALAITEVSPRARRRRRPGGRAPSCAARA